MPKNIVFSIYVLLLSSSLAVGGFLLIQADADAPPRWRNQTQSTSTILKGGSISLQAEGLDLVSLRRAVLSTNETGTWRNMTECSFLWKQEAVYGLDNFGTATYEDGILYAPSKCNHVSDGKIYAINASNGNIIWNSIVRQCDGSPCIDGDVIYVGECFSVIAGEPVLEPKAIALNKINGKEIWHYSEPEKHGWVGSPIVHDDYVYYTTGYHNYATHVSSGSGVYALNKTTGEKIWQQDIGFIVGSAAYHEGVVFVSGSNHANPQGQYALNATTGDIIWHVNYGPSWDSSPVVYNGMLIQVVSSSPGLRTTCVLNETNGQLIWRFWDRGSPSTPLIYDGRIFIPDDDGRMWAFDLETGEEIWRTAELHDGTLQNNSYCSPAAADGAIYYQSLNGTFYVLNETDGDILWSYALNGFGFGSPSIGDGCVFITNDAGLYGFRIGPGSGNWPMFCQNHLHRSHSEQGIEYVRWPLTQPKDFTNSSNVWKVAKFFWCNKTISSGAIAWRVYFFDDVGNTNATGIRIFQVIMIDLNDDGIVNIVDISIVAVAFGSTPEDQNWNIIADLNNDEVINILDISTVAMKFGRAV